MIPGGQQQQQQQQQQLVEKEPAGDVALPLTKARPGRPASLTRKAEEQRKVRIQAAMLLLYLMDR